MYFNPSSHEWLEGGALLPPPPLWFLPFTQKNLQAGLPGSWKYLTCPNFLLRMPLWKKNYSTPSQSIFETRSIQKYFFFALTKKFCVQTLIKWFVDIIEFSFRFLGPPYKQYEVFFSHKECWVSKKSLSPKEFLENTQNLRF